MRTIVLAAFKLLLLSVLALSSSLAKAQLDPLSAQGIKTYGSYNVGAIANVDLSNRNVYAKIPLYSVPRPGKVSLSYSLVLNNNGFRNQVLCSPDWSDDGTQKCTSYLERYGWIGPHVVLDQALSYNVNVVKWDLDGLHSYPGAKLVPAVTDETGNSHSFAWDTTNWNRAWATDGSGYRIDYGPAWTKPYSWVNAVYPSCSDAGSWVYLYSPSGIRQSISQCNPSGTSYTPGFTTMSDLHGNVVRYSESGRPTNASGPFSVLYFPDVITDASGTVIVPSYIDAPSSTDSADLQHCPNLNLANQIPERTSVWTVPGPNSGQIQFRFCYVTIRYSTDMTKHLRRIRTLSDSRRRSSLSFYPMEPIGDLHMKLLSEI